MGRRRAHPGLLERAFRAPASRGAINALTAPRQGRTERENMSFKGLTAAGIDHVAGRVTDSFDGATHDPAVDGPRLSTQIEAIRQIMADGGWRTLNGIVCALASRGITASEAGVSARLRDLRKTRFGGHKVERQRMTPKSGQYLYRVVAAG